MNQSIEKTLLSLATLSLFATAALARDTVVTISNAAEGNSLEVYSSNYNGSLTKVESIPTGGNGLGAGLGSQGAVVFDHETGILATVNAGSNSVSLFRAKHGEFKLINTFASGGTRPVSVALNGDLVYVLNQGDSTHESSVRGFRLVFGGTLALEDSGALSMMGYVNPAQISFSPNGRSLVVTEKATNKIDVLDVSPWGEVKKSQSFPSSGMTPFGFAFDREGHLFVSEAFGGAADGSALSSYQRGRHGGLRTITASAKTNQTAACWVALTPNGKFAFTTNAGSGTVSTFRIAESGAVALAHNSTPIVGSTPIDAITDGNGKYLYVLLGRASKIQTFRVAQNGSLTATSDASTPAGSVGLTLID